MPPPPPDPTATAESGIAAAVIVAAGLGERFGLPAKVLVSLGGRPMLAWSLDAAHAARSVRDVIVVAGPHTRAAVEALLAGGTWPKVVAVVEGGARRQDSVAAGVAAVDPALPIVAVHDAARPLVTAAHFDAGTRAALATGAAIAAVPVADTLKRVEGDRVVGTVPRDGLWAAQTPQTFRRGVLLDALASAAATGLAVTDEAALCEALGIAVAVVAGDPTNLKVTLPPDLALAEALLAARLAAPEDPS